MKKYYVNNNAQSNGDHEVHHQDCLYLPLWQNRIFLGGFSNCKPAETAAKKYYDQVNGCKTCSNECNTQ